MFDHNPFSIGVSGGFARDIAREVGAQADLVVAIGASLNYYTVDGGHMFPKAEMVQIDIEPLGLRHGMKSADLHLRADAKLAAAEIAQERCARAARPRRRSARRSSRGGSRTSRPTAPTSRSSPALLDPRARRSRSSSA